MNKPVTVAANKATSVAWQTILSGRCREVGRVWLASMDRKNYKAIAECREERRGNESDGVSSFPIVFRVLVHLRLCVTKPRVQSEKRKRKAREVVEADSAVVVVKTNHSSNKNSGTKPAMGKEE